MELGVILGVQIPQEKGAIFGFVRPTEKHEGTARTDHNGNGSTDRYEI